MTHKKLTTLIAELFSEDISNYDQIFLETLEIMPLVEKFVVEKLTDAERATVDIRSPREMFLFIQSIGEGLIQ
jgi:hypothetical protein